MQQVQLEKIRPDEVQRLVFSGGGTTGAAHVTALAALIACGADPTKFVALNGTSIGAIISSMIAAGYDVDSMFSIMRRVDLTRFMEDKGKTSTTAFVVKGLSKYAAGENAGAAATAFFKGSVIKGRVAEAGGVFKVDKLRDWVEEMFSTKTEVDFCTFSELHALAQAPQSPYRDLEVIAFNANTNSSRKFSWKNSPNVVISSAVAASAALPGFFEKCTVQKKDADNGTVEDESPDLYADGGLINNYDIAAWDLNTNGDEIFKRSVLGFRLTTSEKIDFLRGTGLLPNQAPKPGIFNFVGEMADAIASSQFNTLINSPKNWIRTVPIDTKQVKPVDVELMKHAEQFEVLLKSGWDSVCDYFGKKLEFPEKYKVTPSVKMEM